MFWLQPNESEHLISFLKPDSRVLEWGSGGSTVEFSNRCGYVFSVEHDRIWYNNISAELNMLDKHNWSYWLCEPQGEFNDSEGDGEINTFKNYIQCPKGNKPFDVIFIDGRARLHCAKAAIKLSHKDTNIFVDDYDLNKPERAVYGGIEKFLTKVNQVGNLAHFKI